MRDYLRTVSLCFEFGKTTELQSRSRESGFKPPMSDAHLTIYRAVKLPECSNKRALSFRLGETQTIISNAVIKSMNARSAAVSDRISSELDIIGIEKPAGRWCRLLQNSIAARIVQKLVGRITRDAEVIAQSDLRRDG